MHKTVREVLEETAAKARREGNRLAAERLWGLISWADEWCVASLLTEEKRKRVKCERA